ncbi:diguanylate cyclase domain-containing protein [Vibrio sp. TRT 21S02]|uniref:sensor domain-containing diguanylate cyclase n=1 Tax=Vibrio sp. TRT 21S02 TaxID=3418507 RepID=UPI003CF74280
MESFVFKVWESFVAHSFDVAFFVLCSLIVIWVYARYQQQLNRFILDSPTALMLVDSESGKVFLVSGYAMQLLGIRQVGKAYLLPASVPEGFFSSILANFSGQSFSGYMQNWMVTENSSLGIELSGRKTLHRGKPAWLIYIKTCQTSEFNKQELQTLSIAQSAFDNLSELIYIKNNQGELISTNRAFDRFWREREEEGSAEIKGVMKGRVSNRRWTTTPDGRSCLLETYQSILMSAEGEKLGTLGISHDVTDWHQMQQNLRDEMEKRKDTEVALAQRDTILQNILESSPDSIGIFNENLVYQACNEPFVKALGIADVNELIGKRLRDVVSGEMYQRLSETDSKVLHEGKSLRYIDRVKASDGGFVWYDVVKSPFRDPASGTNGVLIMARDVTERYLAEQKLEEANQELARLSFIDGLTQIANRRKFDEQLAMLWHLHVREKTPLTVMLCDIDFFKGYNDRYGHQKGDDALIKVANVFKKVLSRSTDCVARYGGEEFAFLLPNTTSEGALLVAKRIHLEIENLAIEHLASDVSSLLTVSIGIVSYAPKPIDNMESIVALADSALYQAKANGRNQTCVHHTSDN